MLHNSQIKRIKKQFKIEIKLIKINKIEYILLKIKREKIQKKFKIF